MNLLSLACHFVMKNLCGRRRYSKDYYDILNVNKSCSNKEIKESFLKLSKQLHPDRSPNDPNSHAKFVQLNEAYSVLSKPNSRHLYDQELLWRKHTNRQTQSQNPNPTGWKDETLWSMRNTSEDKHYEGRPYYGIKGVERVSNSWIVAGCLVFMVVGSAIQFYSINLGRGLETTKSKLQQESLRNSYLETRKHAKEFDLDQQLDRLRVSIYSDRNQIPKPKKPKP